MNDLLLAVGLSALAALLTRLVGAGSGRLIDDFAALIGGWRPDPWPRGVQEEDRDLPWGRGASTPERAAEPPPPKPTLVRVRATVRGR